MKKAKKGSLVAFLIYSTEEAPNFVPRVRERYPRSGYTVRTFDRSVSADNLKKPIVVVVVRTKEKA